MTDNKTEDLGLKVRASLSGGDPEPINSGTVGKIIDLDEDNEYIKVQWFDGSTSWIPYEEVKVEA